MQAKKIRELVRILEESTIGELEITYWWGRKVRISKNAPAARMNAAAPSAKQIEIVTAGHPGVAPLPVSPADPASSKPQEPSPYIEIKAPMVGTFYRAPSPDADPYAKEGDRIKSGQVLCIIEAMKLMNEIDAEVSGTIAKIMVENGRPVEYNQTLFLILPEQS